MIDDCRDEFDCDGGCDYCIDHGICQDEFDEEEEEDSGFLGSMMEAQLVRDGQIICPDCKLKVSSILNQEKPNPCQNRLHLDFKALFDVRLEIGKRDLAIRGYD